MKYSRNFFFMGDYVYLQTESIFIKLLFFKNKVQEQDELKFIDHFIIENILEINDSFFDLSQAQKDYVFTCAVAVNLIYLNLIKQYQIEKGEL